jgi:membrane-associated phospholipid phosphatase
VSAAGRRLIAVGAGLFEVSRLAARRSPVEPSEEAIFRAANGADDRLRIPVRTVMQAGTFATVPVTAIVLALLGNRRLAAEVAVGGTTAWLIAKAVKPLGGRSRPEGVLDDVTTRERIAGDLGWVSGHTAVSTALATTIASAYPRLTVPLVAVVGTTAFGRMYVGAHLPLDLVGGAGLGLMIAGAIVEVRPS